MVTGCGGRAGRTPRVAAAAVCAKRPRPAPQARARGPPNASAPACLVPAPPPRGRGLVAREAPACDPGHRGRGRGSSAEPAGVAQLTRQPAGNYLVGELPRIFPGCCQRFAMQPLSLTSSFLPLPLLVFCLPPGSPSLHHRSHTSSQTSPNAILRCSPSSILKAPPFLCISISTC